MYSQMITNELGEPLGVETYYDDEPEGYDEKSEWMLYADDDEIDMFGDRENPETYGQPESDLNEEWLAFEHD